MSVPAPNGFVDAPPADRELNEEIVREVLRDQFPQLALQSVKHLGTGWGSLAGHTGTERIFAGNGLRRLTLGVWRL